MSRVFCSFSIPFLTGWWLPTFASTARRQKRLKSSGKWKGENFFLVASAKVFADDFSYRRDSQWFPFSHHFLLLRFYTQVMKNSRFFSRTLAIARASLQLWYTVSESKLYHTSLYAKSWLRNSEKKKIADARER